MKEINKILEYYDDFIDHKIINVLAKPFGRVGKGETVNFEYIHFVFKDRQLYFSVNIDTDEIEVIPKYNAQNIESIEQSVGFMRMLIGKKLSWAWFSTNSQGYFDMITFSFWDDITVIEPKISFVSSASTLSVHYIGEFKVE